MTLYELHKYLSDEIKAGRGDATVILYLSGSEDGELAGSVTFTPALFEGEDGDEFPIRYTKGARLDEITPANPSGYVLIES